jgi:hypothetical protein
MPTPISRKGMIEWRGEKSNPMPETYFLSWYFLSFSEVDKLGRYLSFKGAQIRDFRSLGFS